MKIFWVATLLPCIHCPPHFLRLPRSEGIIDSLCLVTYLALRIGKGEMDDNNNATYMMQGSNYNDTRKPQGGRIKMRSPC